MLVVGKRNQRSIDYWKAVCIQLLKQVVGWPDQSSSGLQLISLRTDSPATFRDAIISDVCWPWSIVQQRNLVQLRQSESQPRSGWYVISMESLRALSARSSADVRHFAWNLQWWRRARVSCFFGLLFCPFQTNFLYVPYYCYRFAFYLF